MQIAPTGRSRSVFSLGIGDAVAKLVDVSLAQLVHKSQIIARGHTSRAEKDGLKVSFEVEQVLKGSLRPGENLVYATTSRTRNRTISRC